MVGSFNNKERRSHPRFMIDLPLEYRDIKGSCLRRATLVNASEGGFLIETVSDIPVGTELSITVVYPKGFELVNVRVVAKIICKERYRKEDWKENQYWEGYRYGLEFIQVSEEDRWKLNILLDDQFEIEEILQNLRCQHY